MSCRRMSFIPTSRKAARTRPAAARRRPCRPSRWRGARLRPAPAPDSSFGLRGAATSSKSRGMSRGLPCAGRSPLAPTSSSSRSVSAMRLRATSTSSTFTLTMSPGFTTSRGSLIKVFDIAEMCTSPSWCTPISTKAPNAATLVTVPSRIMPRLRSFSVSTPSLNTAALNAGRGSRPGFSSSRRMSVTVGSPKVSSTKLCGFSCRTISALPIKRLDVALGGG